jgi:lathosterol oxidase
MDIQSKEFAFEYYVAGAFLVILIRYFLISGGMYLLFYSSFSLNHIKLQFNEIIPSLHSVLHDIRLSVFSAGVFALASALILTGYNHDATLLYSSCQQYGLVYLGLSYCLVLLVQDTWFYFTHRLFHHPSFFRWFHQGHHRSRQPTPWTSFAFDPLEAVVQSLFLIVIVFVIPLHFVTVIAVLTTMTVWAVLNHLSVDRLPGSFPHHWLGKWFIGPAHHSLHHKKYNFHYGLYFTFWDKLLGTQDPNFEQTFFE